MNDDKIRISPDALIAMIVTEAQDRELARMPSLEEMNEDFQPSEKFQRKMEALVRDTKRKAEREKRLLNVKRFFITLTAAISIFSCTIFQHLFHFIDFAFIYHPEHFFHGIFLFFCGDLLYLLFRIAQSAPPPSIFLLQVLPYLPCPQRAGYPDNTQQLTTP